MRSQVSILPFSHMAEGGAVWRTLSKDEPRRFGCEKYIFKENNQKKIEVCMEDFEEVVFDYFLYEHNSYNGGNFLKEISNRDIKKFIIRELKNGQD